MIYVPQPGDWSETLVFHPVSLDDATELAKVATAWLVERGAIESAPWFNIFGPIGRAAGAKASSVHEATSEPPQYGLVEIWASGEATKGEGIIVMGKRGPIMLRCPKCGARQGFTGAVLDGWEANAEVVPQCNACHHSEEFDLWDGEGDFACARLTITFNHWPPIGDGFKQELTQILDRRLRTVIARP